MIDLHTGIPVGFPFLRDDAIPAAVDWLTMQLPSWVVGVVDRPAPDVRHTGAEDERSGSGNAPRPAGHSAVRRVHWGERRTRPWGVIFRHEHEGL